MTVKPVCTVIILSVFIWICLLLPTSAYEVRTHQDISQEAVLQSGLNTSLPHIGLSSFNEPIETDYLGFEPRPVLFWIRYGAEHEDDTVSDGLSLFRYLNHFYNPLTGNGLSFHPCVGGTVNGFPSPDWGLEEGQAASANQIFSLKDAREYFSRGLT